MDDPFSPDYATARERFVAAANRAELATASYPIAGAGPDGEPLSIDAAGDLAATGQNLLIVSSGLHGVEGFFGAAVQQALLAEIAGQNQHASGVRVVLLHGLNPFGFAWRRRFNEENVDPNRNFLLAGQEYSGCPAEYEQLDPLLNPPRPPSRWDLFRLRALAAIARYGMPAIKQAVAGGQYEFPRGLFYGGDRLCASGEVLRAELPKLVGDARRVVQLDFHTGLGEWGTHKLLVDRQWTPAQRAWLLSHFDPLAVEANDSAGTAYSARGVLGPWCEALLPAVEYAYFCAEFGTYSPVEVLRGLRAENQAHHWQPAGSRAQDRTKQRLVELFCPASPTWRKHVVADALQLVHSARVALSDS
jgi:hypothetical protein